MDTDLPSSLKDMREGIELMRLRGKECEIMGSLWSQYCLSHEHEGVSSACKGSRGGHRAVKPLCASHTFIDHLPCTRHHSWGWLPPDKPAVGMSSFVLESLITVLVSPYYLSFCMHVWVVELPRAKEALPAERPLFPPLFWFSEAEAPVPKRMDILESRHSHALFLTVSPLLSLAPGV
jgi:hypothetical protein